MKRFLCALSVAVLATSAVAADTHPSVVVLGIDGMDPDRLT